MIFALVLTSNLQLSRLLVNAQARATLGFNELGETQCAQNKYDLCTCRSVHMKRCALMTMTSRTHSYAESTK
jgi:hypothetical protein